ncbi:MAG: small subunit ribosomal protein [Candidatus Methanomethylophilaceae archaeon]|jgi:SSU ribosomal protein S3P|nr:small subunit ribosomal protein [Candidatus Methanomethylophilaceae archaeon]MDI3541655.1 small subunit ribosomal protein [Candidatus Methanomethylophilaceae archaeon]HIJ00913.1 30S ribosomal protein S3 [Candidatus Methanomethylophilaceae archaeon]
MASERKFVAENVRRVLLKEYLMKEVSRAGFGGLDIQRTPMGTRVTLITERPGLVIGRRGQAIKNLTTAIENNFGFDNPQIEVQEVEDPNLNAQIMAEKLAFALERGWHFRRAGHSTVRRIMESGARGCQVVISGKLTGQRHRCEKFKEGYIKFCGEPKLQFIDHGYAVAKLKQGVIGCTVEIMRPDAKLPSDITVLSRTEAAIVLPELFTVSVDELDDVEGEMAEESGIMKDTVDRPNGDTIENAEEGQ